MSGSLYFCKESRLNNLRLFQSAISTHFLFLFQIAFQRLFAHFAFFLKNRRNFIKIPFRSFSFIKNRVSCTVYLGNRVQSFSESIQNTHDKNRTLNYLKILKKKK